MHSLTLNDISKLFASQGCKRILVKILALNDNSKNQVYLGGHDAIHFLPSTKTILNKQTSRKKNAKKFIFINELNFYWLNNHGPHQAPHAKLIYYPQYPETRFSGFLRSCSRASINVLFDEKRKRHFPKRILFLSSNTRGESFGYVLPITPETEQILPFSAEKTPFHEISVEGVSEKTSQKKLLSTLKKIHGKGWLQSHRINRDGHKIPYNYQNGGGYTLEAELGIAPNSDIAPDYDGWEIKQHSHSSKIITLLTPEPDAGIYYEKGVGHFIKMYGYPDTHGKVGRINFGGIYRNNGMIHNKTNLCLKIVGFFNGKLSDGNGFIGLFNSKNEPVAKWTFPKLLAHWCKKHTRTAFILSERKQVENTFYYRYSNEIEVGVGTNFINFMSSVEAGHIYLDPALKLEKNPISGEMKVKARNQFRINIKNLGSLYDTFEKIIL